MNTFFDQNNATRMGKILMVLAILATLFVCVKFVSAVKNMNRATDIAKATTIDVSGEGKSFAIPDIANVSFTVEQKEATVHEAQEIVTKKSNDAIAFLKSSGIAEKDIQTTNYSANPQYDYSYSGGRSPKLTGYIVSNTVTVKIRDTASVGKIIDGLGSKGVTGLNGPNFTVDDPNAINAEARAKAIADAKAKAEVLARDLGVRLVRIVRFTENGRGGYPVPMYAKDMAQSAGNAAPELAVGENTFTSNVTITYEIR